MPSRNLLRATESAAKFVCNTNYQDIPRDVLEQAKRCILDFIGVSIAGSRYPIGGILRNYIAEEESHPRCTVIGLGVKTSTTNGAFANGTLGHALDFDDMIFPLVGHPTVPVIPAVLALAERLGANGRDALLAFNLGFDVLCKLGGAVAPAHWYKGFHSTATVGTFGAVLAASKLLKLGLEQTLYALGIAGSQAAGLKQNLGTMTKPFHAGHAAECGVRAAFLARNGFTAAKDVLEGRFGFCRLMTDNNYDLKKLTDGLGERWDIVDPGVFIKPYPSCGGTHAAITAMLSLINEHGITPEQVERVDAGMNAIGPEELIYTDPKTALEGKFSMQFVLAMALLYRKVKLELFTDDKVTDPGTIDMMKKVTLYIDEEISRDVPREWGDKTAVVNVKLKNGTKYRRRVDIKNISDEDLFNKFRDCCKGTLPEGRIETLLEKVMHLERVDSIGELMSLTHN